jgi:hypothetical protein
LEALAAITPFTQFRVGATVAERPVTVNVDRVLPYEAIVAVLKAAELDFAFAGGPDSATFRLMAADLELSGRSTAFAADAPAVIADAASGSAPAQQASPRDRDAELAADATASRPAPSGDLEVELTPDTTAHLQSMAVMDAAMRLPRLGASGAIGLPFPDAAGAPAFQQVTPQSPRGIPFPVPVLPMPKTPTPAPDDPSLRKLFENLAPNAR